MQGNWRLAVWVESMMPPLGKWTEMLGLARRLEDWWLCSTLRKRYQRRLVKMMTGRRVSSLAKGSIYCYLYCGCPSFRRRSRCDARRTDFDRVTHAVVRSGIVLVADRLV
jgi:hypothetical protein